MKTDLHIVIVPNPTVHSDFSIGDNFEESKILPIEDK